MRVNSDDLNSIILYQMPISFILAVLVVTYMLSSFKFPLYGAMYWYNHAFFVWGYITGMYVFFFLAFLIFDLAFMFISRIYEHQEFIA
jgi:hypothetical protein